MIQEGDEAPVKVRDWVKVGFARGAITVDPMIDQWNRTWNTLEYRRIQSEGSERFNDWWNEKMRRMNKTKDVATTLGPQTKPLIHFIDWWRTNNPYMNGKINQKQVDSVGE